MIELDSREMNQKRKQNKSRKKFSYPDQPADVVPVFQYLIDLMVFLETLS